MHGLGWFVQNYHGLKCIWHFGNDPDEFSGTYIKVPEKGLSLILLANSDALSGPFYRTGILTSSVFVASFLRIFISEDQAGHILQDPNWITNSEVFDAELLRLKKLVSGYSYDGEQAGYAAMMKWIDDRRKHAFTPIKVDAQTFDAYLGQYQIADGQLFTTSKEGRRLFLQQQGETRVELFAESSIRFFSKMVDAELMFVRDSDGKVTQMEIYQGGQTLVAKKVK
mgnify:CR=1 FL=1